ncbi:hypothetical protein DPEC_G00327450 [Dallia pectoralis]|uniref:Uncharacterized protein n=1 Tax=Dallia pectoralis TaxID=75939 RepID=A0ACC2F8D8_DALPE|nr:hypothetical protein DPEC_G00327450 [Dallia pectoralis]
MSVFGRFTNNLSLLEGDAEGPLKDNEEKSDGATNPIQARPVSTKSLCQHQCPTPTLSARGPDIQNHTA